MVLFVVAEFVLRYWFLSDLVSYGIIRNIGYSSDSSGLVIGSFGVSVS